MNLRVAGKSSNVEILALLVTQSDPFILTLWLSFVASTITVQWYHVLALTVFVDASAIDPLAA